MLIISLDIDSPWVKEIVSEERLVIWVLLTEDSNQESEQRLRILKVFIPLLMIMVMPVLSQIFVVWMLILLIRVLQVLRPRRECISRMFKLQMLMVFISQ